MPDLMAVTA